MDNKTHNTTAPASGGQWQDTVEGINAADLMRRGMAAGTGTPSTSQRLFELPPMDKLAETLPQFEFIELIGAGGMGAVYKVRQRELDRIVALKILPQEISYDPAFADQFAREAKALARLNHPHIVTLYEFGHEGELYYIVMEYVDGVNLRRLMDNGPIGAHEALAIVPQICDALQYAHDLGIVHRDIKPENILLDRQGHVKVADFGLAKLISGGQATASAPSSDISASTDTILTRDGMVMGTPAYMAPEQFTQPGQVDNRADIYALGVVFYQMLTGELPDKPLTPPSRRISIDVKLDEIVLKALEQDPEKRFTQASIMRTGMETINTGSTPSRPWKRYAFIALMGALGGLTGAGVSAVSDPQLARIILYIVAAILMLLVAVVIINMGARLTRSILLRYNGWRSIPPALLHLPAIIFVLIIAIAGIRHTKFFAESKFPEESKPAVVPAKNTTPFEKLFHQGIPPEMHLQEAYAIPKKNLHGFEKTFGGKLEQLRNFSISLDGRDFYLNAIWAADSENADKIYQWFVNKEVEFPYLLRKGNLIINYHGKGKGLDHDTVLKASRLLGFIDEDAPAKN